MQKYAKNMHVYAKYVSMKFMCIICTSHFADDTATRMLSVANSNPNLPTDALACWWRRCGVTWDAVPEQSWLLKLRRTPAFNIKTKAI